MKKRKIDWPMAAASFLAAALVLALSMVLGAGISGQWILRALLTGLAVALAVLGTLGAMHGFNLVRRAYRAELPSLRSGRAALLLALLFLAGGLGQILYSLDMITTVDRHEEPVEEVVVVPAEDVEIVLMIDVSYSMLGYMLDVEKAAKSFVDGLPASAKLALGFFSGTAQIDRHLTLMDPGAKTDFKKQIEKAPLGSSTNLSKALRTAYDELDPANNQGKNQAVVILTDADGDIDPGEISLYTGSDVTLYSIRIGDGKSATALKQLAVDTGGFDTYIDWTNGDPLAALTDVFQQITQERTEVRQTTRVVEDVSRKLGFADGLILYDGVNDATLYRIVVRCVFFALFAVLLQLLLFPGAKFGAGLGAGLLSLGASVGVTLFSGLHAPILCALVLALCLYTVFPTVQPGDDPNHTFGETP